MTAGSAPQRCAASPELVAISRVLLIASLVAACTCVEPRQLPGDPPRSAAALVEVLRATWSQYSQAQSHLEPAMRRIADLELRLDRLTEASAVAEDQRALAELARNAIRNWRVAAIDATQAAANRAVAIDAAAHAGDPVDIEAVRGAIAGLADAYADTSEVASTLDALAAALDERTAHGHALGPASLAADRRALAMFADLGAVLTAGLARATGDAPR